MEATFPDAMKTQRKAIKGWLELGPRLDHSDLELGWRWCREEARGWGGWEGPGREEDLSSLRSSDTVITVTFWPPAGWGERANLKQIILSAAVWTAGLQGSSIIPCQLQIAGRERKWEIMTSNNICLSWAGESQEKWAFNLTVINSSLN